MTTLYDFEIRSLQGKELNLSSYKGKVGGEYRKQMWPYTAI